MDWTSFRPGAFLALGLAAAATCFPVASAQAAGWEPSQPVRLFVPGSVGGGADEMARVIQGIVARQKLMGQPIEVINRPGKGGAESFSEVQSARGNPHVLVMGVTNLFTTPLATGTPGWREMTPVSMLALDQFVLWVNAEFPHKTVAQFIEAAKAGGIQVGGTGSKQEDELITSAMGRAIGASFSTRRSAAAPRSRRPSSSGRWTRRSTTRRRPRPSGCPASFARSACSTARGSKPRPRSRAPRVGATSRPARSSG